MPRVHFVKKARVDNPVVKRGESYYWWKFAFCGRSFSKTRPRQSQLTRSAFLGTLYGIQEQIEDTLPGIDTDGFDDFIQDITGQIQDLIDETQGSLENMPYQLQEAETGQLMQERIDGLEGWISDLEAIDTTPDTEVEDDRDAWADGIREEIVGTDPGIY